MRRKNYKKVINNIPKATSENTEYLDMIDKIYYINLEHRLDRRQQIEEELNKFLPSMDKVKRFNAIKKENGALGCAISHLKIIEDAIEKNYSNIIIFEDDFQFIVPQEEINKSLNNLFFNIKDFNICMLSANIYKTNVYRDGLNEVINGQTASGYVVNRNIFEKLKDIYRESVNGLSQNKPYKKYAIDQNWKKLQGKGKK